MSKTERALTSDEAGALDEEADETRDSTEEIWAQVDQALDEYAAEHAVDDDDEVDEVDEAIEDVDVADVEAVDDDDEVDEAIDVDGSDGVVVDEAIEDVDVADVEAVDDDDEVDEAIEDVDVAEVEAVDLVHVDDVDVADLEDVDPEDVDVEDVAEVEAVDLDVEGSADPDGVVAVPLPEIVPATPDDDPAAFETIEGTAVDDAEARESGDDDAVSEEILEELRRADIDGPIVEAAPQDDTTAARRRPKRAPDYDPAPMPIPAQIPRVLGRKPRVRKVTRVVRHVDPWSVFKIALVAHLVLYVILLTAGVLLWNVAHATGTVDNVERFFESFGWDTFEFNGGEIYHAAWIAGLFGVIGLTGLAVLMATLFNLITDLVGGMRFTVLEEEVVETRTSPMRRFVIRRPEPVAPARIEDASGPMIREAVVDDSGAIVRPSR